MIKFKADSFFSKDGDIKVNIEDLKAFFNCFDIIVDHVESTHGDSLSEFNGIEMFLDYFKNKYVVLNDLRNREKTAYDEMKMLNDSSKDDSVRRDSYGRYIEAKHNREKLQESIKIFENDFFS